VDDPRRSYKDANHKPELACALTEFHALSGFRPVVDTVRLLRNLDVPELSGDLELLTEQPDPDGLRAVFSAWIDLAPDQLANELIPVIRDRCHALLRRAEGDPADQVAVEFKASAQTILELSERYPGNVGVLAALLLNRVTLAPGQGLYQPAGVPHAYLSGACIELMANSDNVLRGGLSTKHVDADELIRVLDFNPGPPRIVSTKTQGALTSYETDAEEFELSRLDWPQVGYENMVRLLQSGPKIVLCVSGAANVSASSGDSRMLQRGDSLWVDACDTEVTVRAEETATMIFLATAGQPPCSDGDYDLAIEELQHEAATTTWSNASRRTAPTAPFQMTPREDARQGPASS